MTGFENLPLLSEADVIVCGGGTAGVFAAVAAAEQGASALLLEQSGCVGGAATQALVTPMMSLRLPEDVTCSYLSQRMGNVRSYDPVILGWELEKMCLAAGVQILYHTTLCDAVCENGTLREAVLACKKGLMRVRGKVFIDATGDGDLCCFAGAAYGQGAQDTGANQPMSLRYLMGGVNLDILRSFLQEQGQKHGPAHTAKAGETYHQVYAAVMTEGDWALKRLFSDAIAAGDLTHEDMAYWQLFGVPGRRDAVTLNNPEFFDLPDATDPAQLTAVQIRGREAIFRQLAFCRKYFPGCENAYISQIAPMVGVRESRRIRTGYMLTAADLAQRRKFRDRIAQSNYPVDIHGLSLDRQARAEENDRPWFEVPYRCLVVEGFRNLLVAGRCIGSDFTAQSALRIQFTCRSLGEAAGIAAAMALEQAMDVSCVDGCAVADRMAALGAKFL